MSKNQPQGPNLKEPRGVRPSFISDIAITNDEQDRLGHGFFVNQIVSMILGCDPRYPFNIGLFGKWGSGKTGIINLLKKRIETDDQLKKQVDFAYIDVWKFSKESLRQEILVELNRKFGQLSPDEIQERLYYVHEEETEVSREEPWKRRLKRMVLSAIPYLALSVILILTGAFLSWHLKLDLVAPLVVLVLIPLLLQTLDRVNAAASAVRRTSKRIIPQASSPQEFEKLFLETISRKKSQRLVIAVDNLDRCDSEIAVEMLGTIKSMMEIPGCIYLIACDNEALERHLGNTKRFEEPDAKEFLRKFFPISDR